MSTNGPPAPVTARALDPQALAHLSKISPRMGANESEDDVHPRCLKEDVEVTLGDLRKRRVQVSSASAPTTKNRAAQSIQAIIAAMGR